MKNKYLLAAPRIAGRVHARHTERRGAILVIAIVVFLVVLLLSATVVRSLTIRRQQVRFEQQRQQASWFADSALQRATEHLRAASDYAGESWRTSVEVDGETHSGVAEIRIRAADNNPQQRIIEVEAQWPEHPTDRLLEQRRRTIDLPSSGATS